MENFKNFKANFNRDFWRAFKDKKGLFFVPNDPKEREKILRSIYNSVIFWGRITDKNIYNAFLSRKYWPQRPLFIDIEKDNWVTRSVPVFTLEDYCIYYYSLKKIEEKIAVNRVENTFGGWTLGGLMRKKENDEMERRKRDYDQGSESLEVIDGVSVTRYSFNPSAWTKAYGELNAKLWATSKEMNPSFVVELDIANFYDSIRLDVLERKILSVVDPKNSKTVCLLFRFLNYWNSDTHNGTKQAVGIPQDDMGDCSRILANFYLQSYDEAFSKICNSMECKYLRYADDQFIFTKERDKIPWLVYKASKLLSNLGLSINQKKVEVRSTDEFIEYRSFKDFDLVKGDDERGSPKKVTKFVTRIFELSDSGELEKRKKHGVSLLNRALFCRALPSIDPSHKDRLMSFLLQDGYLSHASSLHFKKIYELLNDDDKMKFIKKLGDMSQVIFHNSFHYELLNFFESKSIPTQKIEERIEQLKKI